MRYNPTAEIINTVAARDNGPKIIAYFRNGTSATYSAYMLDMLATDPATVDIIDADTGEVIYSA